MTHIAVLALLFSIFSTTVTSDLYDTILNSHHTTAISDISNDTTVFNDNTILVSDVNHWTLIPADKAQLNNWFQTNVKPFMDRKGILDPALVTAESSPKVITVRKDGRGNFKTVSDAINSIPSQNTQRVIVSIGPGIYTEKIKIDQTKPFVTLYGDPNHMPTLVYGDTANMTGSTMNSASMTIEANYFSAVNLIITNSAPRPDPRSYNEQAVALLVVGDKAAFYNCRVYGFQDTICDDQGRHFFKDCYVEGTVDFVFGFSKSLYLNTELHVIPGDNEAFITAQARLNSRDNSGFSFVHCMVTGTGKIAVLGRAWLPFSKVVYAYTEMSDVVNPYGWSDNFHRERDRRVFYGEYKNTGPGSVSGGRVKFSKELTDREALPYIILAFIEGSKWLLPPWH
ncbi:pectinesterase 1-like [Cornus florida]|uniref:pectinesterase 1-like n=1 Tax=Cornus florida TaxID=4283 RepID=UPI00289D20ED|nr:pectinesterase 1-like [Cornus florida]